MEATANKLEAMFNRAESDLDCISRKVDAECENVSAGSSEVNPAKVLQRLNDIKTEYGNIVKEAQAIQEAQKEAMLFFKDQITGLCTALTKLQDVSGLPDAERPPELQEFESMLGIQIPSTSSGQSEASLDDEKGSLGHTYTVNVPAPNFSQGDSTPAKLHACEGTTTTGNMADFSEEPKLSAYEKRVNNKDFLEINSDEFKSVSDLIRGRVKLSEVNQTYRILWTYFKEEKKSGPLNSSQMYKMGLRVTGQTGEAKLKVLRSLKLLNISKKGEVTLL